MKDTNKLNPEIRFSGFTDDWEQRKLGELGRATGGTSIESEFSENGKYKVISIGSYSEDSVYREQGIRAIESEKTKNRVLNEGDLTMILNDKTTSGNIIGRVLLIEKSDVYVYNQRTERIEINHDKFDSLFVYEMLNAPQIRNKIIKQSQGNTQIYVNWPAIAETRYLIPQIDEQQKIGEYFSNLDRLITLHQRKLDLLKEQKKGFLQKMFPKNGAKVPELRFSGFADDWEERMLGDEVRIVMGQSPNSENYTDDPNDYILVQGNADMKNGRVLPRVWTTQVTKQAEKDDLILSVRAPVGDIGKTAYDVVIGRGVAAIKGNEFIFQSLGKMKSDGYWTRYSTGSTFESINSTDIKEAIISVPAIEEQDKIGSFFKQLDETIDLHQRKLDLLKEQKKGFLQKMFV
ncbi:MAG: restriction endonuclease subunit S [Streptococcus infantarius]